MNRRIVGLVSAIVLAAVATVIIISYVTRVDERAREGQELAEVYVAQEDISAGTNADAAIDQGLVVRDDVPASAVPGGAIASLDQIDGQVAAETIFAGEVIVAQRFGDTVATPGGRFDVPDGQQAVSVQVGVVPGVAGFIEPGDTVSVVATISTEGEDEEDATDLQSELLLQNVEVLAVGQRMHQQEGDPTVQRSDEAFIFTLALEAEQVEQLVFANAQGELWFTLLADDEQDDANTPGRDAANLFD